MRKILILILAGSLAALGFSGCKSAQKVTKSDNQLQKIDRPDRDGREIICLYGVPNATFRK